MRRVYGDPPLLFLEPQVTRKIDELRSEQQ